MIKTCKKDLNQLLSTNDIKFLESVECYKFVLKKNTQITERVLFKCSFHNR